MNSMLIDTLSILKVTLAQEWMKLHVPGTMFFIAFGGSIPACFDTIGKGMDTVPNRLDALQFRISEIFSC